MFKGLHHMLGKAATQQESLKHPSAIPIETASTLLAPAHRKAHLKAIKALLHLPPRLYDSLYYRVIARFAEFVQELPETHYGAYSSSGGFLDHGLERASRALSLCLSYFFPDEQSFHNVTSEQALWIYSVFTAGLLMDVGKLAVKYQITLCNRDGSSIKDWLPYSGAMVGQAKFYKFTYIKENRDHLRRLITSLLARQLLTENDATGDGTTTVGGFNWIASNPVILEAWLNMLYGDTRNIASYLVVLPYADQLAIQQQLENERNNPVKQTLFGTSLFDNTQDNSLSDLAAGMALYEWLQQRIADGSLSINQEDSLLHNTEDGLLMNIDELIKQFEQAQSDYQNSEATKTQFNDLAQRYNTLASSGNNYAFLQQNNTLATTKFQNWQLLHRREFLIKLGKQVAINTQIIKTNTQATQNQLQTAQQKQQNNAHLQHR